MTPKEEPSESCFDVKSWKRIDILTRTEIDL